MYLSGAPKKEIIFTTVIILLLLVIYSVGLRMYRDLPQFFLDEGLFYQHSPVLVSIPQDSFLRKMDSHAVIYSHQRDVFSKRDELVEERHDFIFVNLDTMMLSLYRKGDLIKEFAVKARGKDGTFFETPSGLYTIQSKEENHFSTIGSVWMPWSMHFFGNYFVHGWPYYPDGRPVAAAYSGGCIRLSVDDARDLFALTSNNMAILVYNKEDITSTDAHYFQKVTPFTRIQRVPDVFNDISAHAVLAADFDNGQVLIEKNKKEVYSLGSVTKLMTGLVALETIDRFKPLTVTAVTGGYTADAQALREGDTFKSQDFVYPLILASSDDAAELYADQVYKFTGIMNQKARAIGLDNTFFKDATGNSSENVSTVFDMFKFLRYISIHKKPLFDASALPVHTLVSDDRTYIWKNTTWPDNSNNTFIGGMSGSIPDGHTALAGVFATKLSEQGNRPIAIMLLGSQNIEHDVTVIRRYLEENFVYGSILIKKNIILPRTLTIGASVFEALRGWRME